MSIPSRQLTCIDTNTLILCLQNNCIPSIEEMDQKLKYDLEVYEEKEKEIPILISQILKKEANTFSKLVTRDYLEDNAWFVRINKSESDLLQNHGYDIDDYFVKIHAPNVFVKTALLPMIA